MDAYLAESLRPLLSQPSWGTAMEGQLWHLLWVRRRILISDVAHPEQPCTCGWSVLAAAVCTLGARLRCPSTTHNGDMNPLPNFCCSECAGRVLVSAGSPWRRIAERFR